MCIIFHIVHSGSHIMFYIKDRKTLDVGCHVLNWRTSKVSAVLIGAVETEAFSGGADGVAGEAGTGVAVDSERRPVAWW